MLSISQRDLEEVFISNIENNNIEKVKKYLSSGISVDAILHSRQTIWDTNYFSILGKIFAQLLNDFTTWFILALKN